MAASWLFLQSLIFILMISFPSHVITQKSNVVTAKDGYIVNLRVYADKPAVDKLKVGLGTRDEKTVKNYIVKQMRDINDKFFDSLRTTHNLDITIKLEQVILTGYPMYEDNPIDKDGMEYFINPFKEFVLPDYEENKFDVAILLTGINIHDGNSSDGAKGLAPIATICNTDGAVAVVEIVKDKIIPTHVAHELGHILGAGHDDEVCPPNTYTPGNVMTSTTKPYRTNPIRFHFSKCSYTAILDLLNGLNKSWSNCLLG